MYFAALCHRNTHQHKRYVAVQQVKTLRLLFAIFSSLFVTHVDTYRGYRFGLYPITIHASVYVSEYHLYSMSSL